MDKNKLDNYARALIEVAYEKNKIEKIVDDFDNFYEILKENPKFKNILSINDYIQVIKSDFYNDFDPDFKNFLLILKKARLSNYINYIHQRFKKMAYTYEKIAFIRVFSAHELTDIQKENLTKNLSVIIPEKQIQAEFKVDKNLIAGIKILYQGKNLDYTYEKYLEDLFKKIGGVNNGES